MKCAVLFAALTLAGCATAYKPNSFWNDGGFTETEVQPGLYQVRFKGNEWTSAEQTADLAMLRAADLCLARGMNFMFLGDVATQVVQTGVVPGYSTTNASANVYGSNNYAYVSGNSSTTTLPASALYSPETGLTVSCATEKSEKAWDAAFLSRSMRTKYKIASP